MSRNMLSLLDCQGECGEKFVGLAEVQEIGGERRIAEKRVFRR
jgi:hypothetical protein